MIAPPTFWEGTVFRELWQWLTMADYQVAKDKAALDVVKRYSRGNVSTQNGWLLDDEGLRALSAKGDRATAKLKRLLPQAR